MRLKKQDSPSPTTGNEQGCGGRVSTNLQHQGSLQGSVHLNKWKNSSRIQGYIHFSGHASANIYAYTFNQAPSCAPSPGRICYHEGQQRPLLKPKDVGFSLLFLSAFPPSCLAGSGGVCLKMVFKRRQNLLKLDSSPKTQTRGIFFSCLNIRNSTTKWQF